MNLYIRKLERLRVYMDEWLNMFCLKQSIPRGHFFYGNAETGEKVDWADLPFNFPSFDEWCKAEFNTIVQAKMSGKPWGLNGN